MTKREFGIALAAAVMIALIFWVIAVGPRLESQVMPERVSAAAPPPRGQAANSPALTRAPLTITPSTQPPALPFSFLGKLTEGGETRIVLYSGGRTLDVRHAGRLDDQYQVDEIHDDHLVLRYLPLGVQQVLALASGQDAFFPGGSAEDTPQD
jgi:hypothetical protein